MHVLGIGQVSEKSKHRDHVDPPHRPRTSGADVRNHSPTSEDMSTTAISARMMEASLDFSSRGGAKK